MGSEMCIRDSRRPRSPTRSRSSGLCSTAAIMPRSATSLQRALICAAASGKPAVGSRGRAPCRGWLISEGYHWRMARIVTVTPNPALDLTLEVERLGVGAVNIAGASRFESGGKGANVARMLAHLGAAGSAAAVVALPADGADLEEPEAPGGDD